MDKSLPIKPTMKRRRYSAEFKARILAACEQPNISVASVALANGLNANLIHKWRQLAKDKAPPISEPSGFVPIPLACPPEHTVSNTTVMIEVHGIKLHWPLEYIDRAIPWLRALRA